MNQTPIPLLGPSIYDGIEAKTKTTDLFGWNSHHPIFAELIHEKKPKVIIEVGTWKGASAIHMASMSAAHLYCVDTWIGGDGHIYKDIGESQPVQRDSHGWPGIYYQFLHNVKVTGLCERITPVPFMSLHGAWLLEAHGIKADLIYIDGGHNYLDVIVDVQAYFTLLAPGGIMFGDDFNQNGVAQAVNDFMQKRSDTHALVVKDEKWVIRPKAEVVA
jgi:hypothetical protein